MGNSIFGAGCPYQTDDCFNDRNRFQPDHLFVGEIENGKRYPLGVYTKEESDARYAPKTIEGEIDRIDEELAGKAPASVSDDISRIDEELAGKADVSALEELAETVNGKADQDDLDTLENTVSTKADASALTTKADVSTLNNAVANLQGQIDQIEISASAEAVVAPEVAGARVGATGTEYDTLKERLDADSIAAQSDSTVMSLYDLTVGTQDDDGTLHKDLIASANFTEGVTLTEANFLDCTMYTYLDAATSSTSAKLSNPIRVRDFDGTLIADVACTYGSALQSANIGFGFKKDGSHDRKYNATNVSGGKIVFSEDTYYFIILKYTTVPLTLNCTLGKVVTDSFTKKLAFPSLADVESMTVTSGGVLRRDIIDFMPATLNATITMDNFYASTIYTYKTYLTYSATAKVVDMIRVRNEDGSMITPIHCEYGPELLSANICFGYKKDGTHDRVYKAVDVVDGILTLDATTYFIMILKYSTVALELYTLYGRLVIGDSVPHYSVGTGTGVDFNSFTACIRALASDTSEKVIDIYGGEYDVLEEMGGYDFLETLTGSEHWYDVCDIVPPNTTIQGHGNVRIIMELPADLPVAVAALLSPVNIRGSAAIKNVTISGKNCRYAIHPEGSKEAQFNNAVWLIEDCYIEKTEDEGVSVTGVCFACGLNDGVQFTISRTNIETDLQSGFSMHDNGDNFDVSPRVSIDSCAITCGTYPLIYSCTYRQNMETVINVRVSNTYLGNGYVRKRTSNETAKDCYKCVYINSPHRTQHGANITDLIPDTDYNAFA